MSTKKGFKRGGFPCTLGRQGNMSNKKRFKMGGLPRTLWCVLPGRQCDVVILVPRKGSKREGCRVHFGVFCPAGNVT